MSLVNALVVFEFKRVYETCNGHILVFQPRSIFLWLVALCHQAVCLCLATNGNAARRACRIFWLYACNLCIVGATAIRFVVGCIIASLTCTAILFLFALFLVFFSLHCELLGSNFFFGHGYFSVKADVVTMTEKNAKIIVPVPVFG